LTGWTVYDKLFLFILLLLLLLVIYIYYQTSLDSGKSSIRNWILVYIHIAKYTVITSITWGQSDWAIVNLSKFKLKMQTLSFSSSETKRGAFYSTGLYKKDTKYFFEEWFVGFTDGAGTFHFSKSNLHEWEFYFKITQSPSNLRVLYYVKKMLGVGQVSISDNKAEYRIRFLNYILQHIIPIFDKYPLLTSNYFNYSLFKQAALIFSNPLLTKDKKDELLTELKKNLRPTNYISPAWSLINLVVTSKTEAMIVMSKHWLIGFTEAAGSFYIVPREKGRLNHEFEITPNLDKIVITSIGFILGINVLQKRTYFSVVSTNSKTIKDIILYYYSTMKGMKSLEYRIWARSFTKSRNYVGQERFEYLTKIRDKMRKIPSIRLDKNFKEKS
jgi:hypothetical protein